MGQQMDVPVPVAQRRQRHLHHRQPVIQILAKRILRHGLLQINIGRGHHAGIHRNRLPPADPFNRLFLQKTKQLHLQRHGDFTNFIQKKRSVGGRLDPAFSLNMGAGERAFFVSKQFTFQKRFRDGPAIDGHERPFLAMAPPVNRPRRHFLSRAALSQNQHRSLRRRHLPNHFEHRLQLRAVPLHAFKRIRPDQPLYFGVFLLQ